MYSTDLFTDLNQMFLIKNEVFFIRKKNEITSAKNLNGMSVLKGPCRQ